MKKEDKTLLIEKIGETLKQYSCVYLVQSSDLTLKRQALCVAPASKMASR